ASPALRARLSNPGTIIGTVPYMSPEQARGLPLDGRSDLYTVGVIIFELLTRTLPILPDPTAIDSTQNLLTRIPTEPPRALRPLCPDAPPSLLSAVGQALAKAPADRFVSAREFRAALLPSPGPSATAAHATSPVARGRSSITGLHLDSADDHGLPFVVF